MESSHLMSCVWVLLNVGLACGVCFGSVTDWILLICTY